MQLEDTKASPMSVEAPPTQGESSGVDKTMVPLGDIKLLVVEDDEHQADTIVALFNLANEKNAGMVRFVTTVARTATEAISLLAGGGFRIVLLDAMLPDVNGHEVLPRLRELVGPSVSIIMLSAYVQMELVQTCVRRGADAYLTKPLNLGQAMHLWQFVRDLPVQVRPAPIVGSSTATPASSISSSSGSGIGGRHSILQNRAFLQTAGRPPQTCPPRGRGGSSLAANRSRSDPIGSFAEEGGCNPGLSSAPTTLSCVSDGGSGEPMPRIGLPPGHQPGEDDEPGACKQQ